MADTFARGIFDRREILNAQQVCEVRSKMVWKADLNIALGAQRLTEVAILK